MTTIAPSHTQLPQLLCLYLLFRAKFCHHSLVENHLYLMLINFVQPEKPCADNNRHTITKLKITGPTKKIAASTASSTVDHHLCPCHSPPPLKPAECLPQTIHGQHAVDPQQRDVWRRHTSSSPTYYEKYPSPPTLLWVSNMYLDFIS